MTSLITNTSAMNALQQLRQVNSNLGTTQDRISSGLKVSSAKDNAAYFQISQSMTGDSSAFGAINEGMTLTMNSVATARLGAETFKDLAQQFTERVAFAQGAVGGHGEIEKELAELVKQMETTISQATFNGDDMVNAGDSGTATASVDAATGVLTKAGVVSGDRDTVTGVSRADDFDVTTITVDHVDLYGLMTNFDAIATSFGTRAADTDDGETYLAQVLVEAEGVTSSAIDAATTLGLAEKSLENQKEFLSKLVDNLDSGIGSMIDADMEEEAARLKALQTQQQLATQALSIANNAPQGVLQLFQ